MCCFELFFKSAFLTLEQNWLTLLMLGCYLTIKNVNKLFQLKTFERL
jgi:hypothetical protein